MKSERRMCFHLSVKFLQPLKWLKTGNLRVKSQDDARRCLKTHEN